MKHKIYIFFSFFVFFFMCCNGNGGTMFRHDIKLSLLMISLPYSVSSFSEIRIYKTDQNSFLSDQQIDALKPIKILKSKSEMTDLFETMKKGEVSNQDPTFKNFSYFPGSFHLIGMAPEGNHYGCLKIRISCDKGRPTVARVEKPDETNSFEIMQFLPDFLQKIESESKK